MLPHFYEVVAGRYDVPLEINAPVILDIGANVGAFTVWASHRWLNSRIYAYEPIRSNYELLQKNIREKSVETLVTLINKAVGWSDSGTMRMRLGKNNCGEASFYDLGEQLDVFEDVDSIQASELPKANIVKIDTEGCEVPILRELDLSAAKAVMLEFHRVEDRKLIDDFLTTRHAFTLIKCYIHRVDRGVLKYVRV